MQSVAIHGNLLFVGRFGDKVAVYDTMTFSLQRQLSIAGLGERSVWTGHVCCQQLSLRLRHATTRTVHKVDLSTYNVVLKWSVAPNPLRLSVNTTRNVLVVCDRRQGRYKNTQQSGH